jgi:hypothetical protein
MFSASLYDFLYTKPVHQDGKIYTRDPSGIIGIRPEGFTGDGLIFEHRRPEIQPGVRKHIIIADWTLWNRKFLKPELFLYILPEKDEFECYVVQSGKLIKVRNFNDPKNLGIDPFDIDFLAIEPIPEQELLNLAVEKRLEADRLLVLTPFAIQSLFSLIHSLKLQTMAMDKIDFRALFLFGDRGTQSSLEDISEIDERIIAAFPRGEAGLIQINSSIPPEHYLERIKLLTTKRELLLSVQFNNDDVDETLFTTLTKYGVSKIVTEDMGYDKRLKTECFLQLNEKIVTLRFLVQHIEISGAESDDEEVLHSKELLTIERRGKDTTVMPIDEKSVYVDPEIQRATSMLVLGQALDNHTPLILPALPNINTLVLAEETNVKTLQSVLLFLPNLTTIFEEPRCELTDELDEKFIKESLKTLFFPVMPFVINLGISHFSFSHIRLLKSLPNLRFLMLDRYDVKDVLALFSILPDNALPSLQFTAIHKSVSLECNQFGGELYLALRRVAPQNQLIYGDHRKPEAGFYPINELIHSPTFAITQAKLVAKESSNTLSLTAPTSISNPTAMQVEGGYATLGAAQQITPPSTLLRPKRFVLDNNLALSTCSLVAHQLLQGIGRTSTPVVNYYRQTPLDMLEVTDHSVSAMLSYAPNQSFSVIPAVSPFEFRQIYTYCEKDEKSHYLLAKTLTVTLKPGEELALPSYHGNEHVRAWCCEHSQALQLRYNPHTTLNILVNVSKNSVTVRDFNMILQIPEVILTKLPPQYQELQTLADDISGYGMPTPEEVKLYQLTRGRGRIDFLTQHRIGPCSDRTIVFLDRIRKLSRHDEVRILAWRNEVHSFIEVHIKNTQGSIAFYTLELGGYPAKLEIKNDLFPAVPEKPTLPTPNDLSLAVSEKPTLPIPKRVGAPKYFVPEPFTAPLFSRDRFQPGISIGLECQSCDIEAWIESARAFAKMQQWPILVVRKPHELCYPKSHMQLVSVQGDYYEAIFIDEPGGAMVEFNKAADRQKGGLLCIDWREFNKNPSSIVANLTVLESPRMLGETKLNPNIRLLSLMDAKTYDGDEFRSRHRGGIYRHLLCQPNPEPLLLPAPDASQHYLTVDLYDDSVLIEQQLFGQWQMLPGNRMYLKQGKLLAALRDGTPLHIKNAPETLELRELLKSLQKREAVHYYGLSFSIPENFHVVESRGFHFAEYPTIKVRHVNALPLQSSDLFISSAEIDSLFSSYEIKDGEFITLNKGRLDIERYAGKKLTIALASNLRLPQWARLLNILRENNILLECVCTPSVTFPDGLKTEVAPPIADEKSFTIFKSDRPIAQIDTARSQVLAVCVDGRTPQDLLGIITQSPDENSVFPKFQQQSSELIAELERGVHTVLYGEFTPELAALCSAWLIEGRYPQLILCPDEPEMFPGAAIADLSFIEYREIPVINFQDRDIHLESEIVAFLQNREKGISDALNYHRLVVLEGLTASGKSSLVRRQFREKYGKDHFHEISPENPDPAIEAWLHHGGLLFLDEADMPNIPKYLNALVDAEQGFVFWKSRLRRLRPDDRMLMTKNPNCYGAGRSESRLTKAGHKLQFLQLPKIFIKHCLLLPLSPKPGWEAYIDNLLMRNPQFTARKYLGEALSTLAKNDIVCTPLADSIYEAYGIFAQGAHKELVAAFSDCLRQRKLTDVPQGLGGILVTGDSGMGKTYFVERFLQLNGFTPGEPNDPMLDPMRHYLLLPISDPHSDRIIAKAANEGYILVCHEFNAAGKGELFNRVIGGCACVHPRFRVFGTKNPASKRGRSNESDAIDSRFLCLVAPQYTSKEIATLLHLKCPFLSKGIRSDIAAEFLRQRHNILEDKPNLRNLASVAQNQLSAYLAAITQKITALNEYAQGYYSHSIVYFLQRCLLALTNTLRRLVCLPTIAEVASTRLEIVAHMRSSLTKIQANIQIYLTNGAVVTQEFKPISLPAEAIPRSSCLRTSFFYPKTGGYASSLQEHVEEYNRILG